MANLTTSDRRMLELIDILKGLGEIRFTVEFLVVSGVSAQNIRKIRLGAASFTVVQIERVCRHYNVNANWIFGIEKNVFRSIKNAKLA